MNNKDKIICAIDTSDILKAQSLIAEIKDHVGMVKLGLEFFCRNGNEGVRRISDLGVPIFLDLKLHDIPNTVAGAIRSIIDLEISMFTIHTMGGLDMMKKAVEVTHDLSEKLGKTPPRILGVTILTSMNEHDIHAIGVNDSLEGQVSRLAHFANECELDGVVCSPHEISLIKEYNPKLKLVVPGIRTENSKAEDQKRVMTPVDAIAKGADYIVIGRSITAAKSPHKAAEEILMGLKKFY